MHRRSNRLPKLAVVVLALVLTLPGVSGLSVNASDEKILRVSQGIFPGSLDPQVAGFPSEIAVLSIGYEGLTRLDGDLATVPAAAERWETSPDGLTMTFHLRDGLEYSDGTPLTADAFAYAAPRTCDPRLNAIYASILFDVAGCAELNALGPDAAPADLEEARGSVGIVALDDRTLEIHLTQPAPHFATVAGTWVFYPVKRELIEAGSAEWWKDAANHIGNGPFTIAAIEEDQTRIAFTANEHYWGGRPLLDGIEYRYFEDSAVALAAYDSGELDIVDVNSTRLADVKADPAKSTQLLTYPLALTATVQFNLTKEPFTDQKVREAFSYAFDRETWCAEIQSGACNPTLSWIPEGVPGHVPTDAYAFDPALARQALAESSYGGAAGLPTIEFGYVSGDEDDDADAEWVAAQLREHLGVEITLVPLEWEDWQSNISSPETHPNMTWSGWVQDYPDPQNWLSITFACDAYYSQGMGYCNQAYDDLIAQADQELDPETRLHLYEEAAAIIIADAASIMVSNPLAVFLVKPTVTGLAPTPSDLGFPGQFASPLTADITT